MKTEFMSQQPEQKSETPFCDANATWATDSSGERKFIDFKEAQKLELQLNAARSEVRELKKENTNIARDLRTSRKDHRETAQFFNEAINERDTIREQLEEAKILVKGLETTQVFLESENTKFESQLTALKAETERTKQCLSQLLEHADGYQTPNHIEGWEKAVALANEILNTTKSKDNNEK